MPTARVLLVVLVGCASPHRSGLVVEVTSQQSTALLGHFEDQGLPYRMVALPAGRFRMGAEPPAPETPAVARAHDVEISRAFWLGATEVTQGLYQRVMGTTPSAHPGCPSCPVDGVSWLDAVAFCNALSTLDGFRPAYVIRGDDVRWRRSVSGYRLPTEAEWEYAALTGSKAIPGDGWYVDDSHATTHPVAMRAPNAAGLFDMLGNVREWVWDGWEDFDGTPKKDPAGPRKPRYRVVRGGAWDNLASDLRPTARDAIWPTYEDEAQGFRLARNAR